MNITYHKATTNDVQSLVDYRLEFIIGLMGEQPAESTNVLRENLYTYFSQALSNNTYISYLAKDKKKIVGVGGLVLREQPGSIKNPSGKFGYLLGMYTIPSYRRKGICSKILNLLVSEAAKSGVIAFELHATKEGEYVYTQQGFETHVDPTYRKYI